MNASQIRPAVRELLSQHPRAVRLSPEQVARGGYRLTIQIEAPYLAPGELVEAQLDALIDNRAASEALGDPDAEASLAELWARSVDHHNRAMRQHQLWDKLRHHQAMIHAHARNAAALVERHQEELERCEQALGIEARGRGVLAIG